MQVCEAVAGYSEAIGLTFFEECKALGLGSKTAFALYLTGRAPDSSSVLRKEYMKRAATLEMIKKEWLSVWT